MKERIIDFEDLSYSQEMLEAKVPNFIAIFIYLLITLLAVAFIWMWFGEIDIVVKADGLVRPAQEVSVIQNISGGNIKKLNYKEGQQVKKGDLLYKIKTTYLNTKQDNLNQKIKKLKIEIKNLKLLKKSIKEEGSNLLKTKARFYYSRYLIYKYKKAQLRIDCNQAKRRYLQEKSLSVSATTESRLKELKARYKSAQLILEAYKNKTLVDIQQEIKTKKDRLVNLTQQSLETDQQINLSRVTAPISGTIQVLQQFNKGDYMASGLKIIRIIPQINSNYKMEITVPNQEISKLEVGQTVRYRFLSLSYKEYGTLEGEITKISKDANMMSRNSKLPYDVEATIKGTKLYDNQGRPEKIKPGMLSKVRVVVRQKKILYFLLEKLDFIS
ncbi:multidrug resistance efflux pump [Halobacteroides halobius DSM 5150]|uniref:Multidrug resistance efflux pump n=1 Tax=Halobacteroides halobius (strain ATCC 35273 / DSM 5150 / MD-1) TaxID=748449 RepID=L0KBV5_HALHC|nr:HlyD family efflux transporter periplasmic adaptor subunit [Halobacteroides halobius]AGB41839.1 multidrug resistance efflux pump [Halobacteroides halobius DSM 5150]